MVGSKDLPPSRTPFGKVFFHNQFVAKPQWPKPGTTLSGKTALITGGNTGLGYEAAVQLLSLHLSRLILAVRSLSKGETAATKLRSLYPDAAISVWQLDMTSYPSVQALARRAASELPHGLDIALLNAGLVKMTFTTVPSTSHEESLQVNYLSTVLLAILLLPVLKHKSSSSSGSPGRLTIVSAALTLAAKFPERHHNPLLPAFSNPALFTADETYNSTKLLAHLFLWNLAEYISPSDVIVNLADPAWCKGTNLAREVTSPFLKLGVKLFGATTGRSPRVGASCFVDAIVNKGRESHGCFLMSWKTHPFADFCYTEEGQRVRERLWEETMSELEFAGVRGILEDMRKGTLKGKGQVEVSPGTLEAERL